MPIGRLEIETFCFGGAYKLEVPQLRHSRFLVYEPYGWRFKLVGLLWALTAIQIWWNILFVPTFYLKSSPRSFCHKMRWGQVCTPFYDTSLCRFLLTKVRYVILNSPERQTISNRDKIEQWKRKTYTTYEKNSSKLISASYFNNCDTFTHFREKIMWIERYRYNHITKDKVFMIINQII